MALPQLPIIHKALLTPVLLFVLFVSSLINTPSTAGLTLLTVLSNFFSYSPFPGSPWTNATLKHG